MFTMEALKPSYIQGSMVAYRNKVSQCYATHYLYLNDKMIIALSMQMYLLGITYLATLGVTSMLTCQLDRPVSMFPIPSRMREEDAHLLFFDGVARDIERNPSTEVVGGNIYNVTNGK